jgi:hypothetical protein
MSMYYARNGDEITMEQWGKLLGDMDYKRIAKTTFPSGRWVSTVWLGLDHGWHTAGTDNPILIFETMVFNGEDFVDEYMDRYTTEEEALAGHERITAMVRELEEASGRARNPDQAPGKPRGHSEEDQEGDHDLRATPHQGDVHDPQHPI